MNVLDGRRPRRRRATALAACLALAACGGGGGGGDAAPDPDTTGSSPGSVGTTTPTAGPTTTATPAEELAPCPVDALASAAGPVDITVWHAMQADLERTLQALTASYNAGQQKVRVNLVNQVGYVEIFDKYAAASDRDRPAIVQQADYNTQAMADSATAIPVQSCINAEGFDTSDYLPRSLAYYTTAGALQSMPFNNSNPVLFYNRKAFTAAGLDPDAPPTTLEELRAASETIVAAGAARYGLAVDTNIDAGGGWFIEQWFAKAGLLYANNDNGRAGRASEVLWTQPEGSEFLGFVQSMLAEGLAVNVGANDDNTQDLLKLVDPVEPAAMTIHTTAALAPALNILSSGQFPALTPDDLGVAPMPGPSVEPGTLIGGASLWMVAGKDDATTAAAWDFVKYLTTPESQSIWADGTGYVPIRESAVDLAPIRDRYAADPRFRVAYDQVLAGGDTPAAAGAALGPQREIRQIMARATEAIYSGTDPFVALEQAKGQADTVLQDYNDSIGD